MPIVEKKKAPGGNPTPQSQTAKLETVDGQRISLPREDKIILAQVSGSTSDALACLDQIGNDIETGDRPHFAKNVASLCRVLCRFKRLHRALSGTYAHARKEARR